MRFFSELNAVEAAKKAEKERKKREKTAVVGDIGVLGDALPTIELLMKKSSHQDQYVLIILTYLPTVIVCGVFLSWGITKLKYSKRSIDHNLQSKIQISGALDKLHLFYNKARKQHFQEFERP